MSILYNGNKIIPAPFVELRKIYNVTESGLQIGTTWEIQLKGKITAYKGSPNSSKVFWTASGYPPDETIAVDSRFTSILRKQEALRELFSQQGLLLEIQPLDGEPPITCNPRVKQIDFPAQQWVEICDYTITLEADILYISGEDVGEDPDISAYHVSKINNDWNLEAADEFARTYRLTHRLGATGKRFFEVDGSIAQEPWENARDYVLDALTLGLTAARLQAPDVLDLDNFQAFNYMRTQNINELAGTFEVVETWLCFDPSWTPDGTGGTVPAIEIFNINIKSNMNQRATVTIDGTITGLEQRNTTSRALISDRWTNAYQRWTNINGSLLTRCETASGLTLNPLAVNSQYGANEANGVITYAYEYNNRPEPTIGGALSEIITVSFTNSEDVFAILPVIGRAAGPVLQTIGTIKERRKNLNIELVLPAGNMSTFSSTPDTDSLVALFYPIATQVFVERDTESFDPYEGRYRRDVTFVYQ